MYIPFPLTIKVLMAIQLGIWLLGQLLLEGMLGVTFTPYFALLPGRVIFDGHIWQIFTYMFLHSLEFFHIFFNLLMLWFLGGELEQLWGRRNFLIYYFASGSGAALVYLFGTWFYAWVSGDVRNLIYPVVGSSGAIFGLMLAYGILFGERTMYLMFMFPLKAKYLVMILGGIEALSLLSSHVSGSGGKVAHLAHLGGLISGGLILWGTAMVRRFQHKRGEKKPQRSHLKIIVNNESDSQGTKRYWH
jgi:membrane associated rhomboid family serine protease